MNVLHTQALHTAHQSVRKCGGVRGPRTPLNLVAAPRAHRCKAQPDSAGFGVNEETAAAASSGPATDEDEETPYAAEADWDVEMSIFKKRTMRPNQLATLRQLEAKVEIGKVLYSKGWLAIVEGINNDAPVGTKLSFVSGATGVLLWRRSSQICFVLIVGGQDDVTVGEGVECKIAGVLQVVDEEEGPITKRDFQMFKVPAGASLAGRVVDHLCRPLDGGAAAGQEAWLPMLNKQINMEDRDPICDCLLTGVKAVDVLTPLGRGQQMLLVGPRGSGKTALALDALLGQAGQGVRCIYAAVNVQPHVLEQRLGLLREGGAMACTTVVAAQEGASLGQQFATIATACSIAERVREEGGTALLVLDDIKCAVDVWERLTAALATLGEEKLAAGLIKDAQGREVAVPQPSSDEELVVYEGMLVSAAAAMRRSFFGSLLQRAAKANAMHGGGSMTLLAAAPGRPASGTPLRVDMSRYQTLSQEQKTRMQAALEAKAKAAEAALQPAEGELRTDLVEEFMSISDGQVVLEAPKAAARGSSSSSSVYSVSAQLSMSRIGGRAYHKAMEVLAPAIRFDLAQAADARRFAEDLLDPTLQQQEAAAQKLMAALSQPPAQPAALPEQVVLLHALKAGFLEAVPAAEVASVQRMMHAYVQRAAPAALAEIQATKQFTAAAERDVTAALQQFFGTSS